jgi:hypothetical protein
MRNILSFFLLLSFLTSCVNQHYFQLTNGKWVSKKKYDSIIRRCIKKAFKKIPKEDLKYWEGVRFSVDTINAVQ